jgi:hypothetical protein
VPDAETDTVALCEPVAELLGAVITTRDRMSAFALSACGGRGGGQGGTGLDARRGEKVNSKAHEKFALIIQTIVQLRRPHHKSECAVA